MPRQRPHEPPITPLYSRYRIVEHINILQSDKLDNKAQSSDSSCRPPFASNPFARAWLRHWWWAIFLAFLLLLLTAFLIVYEAIIPLLIKTASIEVSEVAISEVEDAGFRIALRATIQGLGLPLVVHGFKAHVLDHQDRELYALKLQNFTGKSINLEQRVTIVRRPEFIAFVAALMSPQDVHGFVTGRVKVEVLRRTLYVDLRKRVDLRGLGPLETRVQSIAYHNGTIETLIDTTYDADGQVSLDFGPSNMTLQFGNSVLSHIHGPLILRAGTTRISTVGKMIGPAAMDTRDAATLTDLIRRGKDVPLKVVGAGNDQSTWASACLHAFEGAIHLSPAQARAMFPELTVAARKSPAIGHR